VPSSRASRALDGAAAAGEQLPGARTAAALGRAAGAERDRAGVGEPSARGDRAAAAEPAGGGDRAGAARVTAGADQAATAGLAAAREPAAPFAGARALAEWKDRVTKAWPGVHIDLVQADDGELHSPGSALVIRAAVALGELSPGDVAVQAVYGRVGDDDEIADPVAVELVPQTPPGPDSVAWYRGEAVLGEPGPFGYTVRVLPAHPMLSSPAELGLITLPVVPAGLLTADLR
jgi:hypothetical protein